MGFKDLRYKSGYTQEEFMKVASMSERTIRRLEKDYREIYKTDDEIVLRLLNIFNCTMDELLTPDTITNKRVDFYNKEEIATNRTKSPTA